MMAILSASGGCAQDGAFAAEQVELPSIAGRVFDSSHKAAAGCFVKVLDEQGDLLRSDRTGVDGSFQIAHKLCAKCMLQVVPGEGTGLASVLLDNLPGEKNRNFIVELHRGFEVSGRVLSDGKGLKGLVVKVVPEPVGTHGDIHGGGLTLTGKDGRFLMTLTPGLKKLQVCNNRYGNLVSRYEIEINIESPLALSDIALPMNQ